MDPARAGRSVQRKRQGRLKGICKQLPKAAAHDTPAAATPGRVDIDATSCSSKDTHSDAGAEGGVLRSLGRGGLRDRVVVPPPTDARVRDVRSIMITSNKHNKFKFQQAAVGSPPVAHTDVTEAASYKSPTRCRCRACPQCKLRAQREGAMDSFVFPSGAVRFMQLIWLLIARLKFLRCIKPGSAFWGRRERRLRREADAAARRAEILGKVEQKINHPEQYAFERGEQRNASRRRRGHYTAPYQRDVETSTAARAKAVADGCRADRREAAELLAQARRPIRAKQVAAYFAKEVPPGVRVEDMPTPFQRPPSARTLDEKKAALQAARQPPTPVVGTNAYDEDREYDDEDDYYYSEHDLMVMDRLNASETGSACSGSPARAGRLSTHSASDADAATGTTARTLTPAPITRSRSERSMRSHDGRSSPACTMASMFSISTTPPVSGVLSYCLGAIGVSGRGEGVAHNVIEHSRASFVNFAAGGSGGGTSPRARGGGGGLESPRAARMRFASRMSGGGTRHAGGSSSRHVSIDIDAVAGVAPPSHARMSPRSRHDADAGRGTAAESVTTHTASVPTPHAGDAGSPVSPSSRWKRGSLHGKPRPLQLQHPVVLITDDAASRHSGSDGDAARVTHAMTSEVLDAEDGSNEAADAVATPLGKMGHGYRSDDCTPQAAAAAAAAGFARALVDMNSNAAAAAGERGDGRDEDGSSSTALVPAGVGMAGSGSAGGGPMGAGAGTGLDAATQQLAGVVQRELARMRGTSELRRFDLAGYLANIGPARAVMSSATDDGDTAAGPDVDDHNAPMTAPAVTGALVVRDSQPPHPLSPTGTPTAPVVSSTARPRSPRTLARAIADTRSRPYGQSVRVRTQETRRRGFRCGVAGGWGNTKRGIGGGAATSSLPSRPGTMQSAAAATLPGKPGTAEPRGVLLSNYSSLKSFGSGRGVGGKQRKGHGSNGTTNSKPHPTKPPSRPARGDWRSVVTSESTLAANLTVRLGKYLDARYATDGVFAENAEACKEGRERAAAQLQLQLPHGFDPRDGDSASSGLRRCEVESTDDVTSEGISGDGGGPPVPAIRTLDLSKPVRNRRQYLPEGLDINMHTLAEGFTAGVGGGGFPTPPCELHASGLMGFSGLGAILTAASPPGLEPPTGDVDVTGYSRTLSNSHENPRGFNSAFGSPPAAGGGGGGAGLRGNYAHPAAAAHVASWAAQQQQQRGMPSGTAGFAVPGGFKAVERIDDIDEEVEGGCDVALHIEPATPGPQGASHAYGRYPHPLPGPHARPPPAIDGAVDFDEGGVGGGGAGAAAGTTEDHPRTSFAYSERSDAPPLEPDPGVAGDPPSRGTPPSPPRADALPGEGFHTTAATAGLTTSLGDILPAIATASSAGDSPAADPPRPPPRASISAGTLPAAARDGDIAPPSSGFGFGFGDSADARGGHGGAHRGPRASRGGGGVPLPPPRLAEDDEDDDDACGDDEAGDPDPTPVVSVAEVGDGMRDEDVVRETSPRTAEYQALRRHSSELAATARVSAFPQSYSAHRVERAPASSKRRTPAAHARRGGRRPPAAPSTTGKGEARPGRGERQRGGDVEDIVAEDGVGAWGAPEAVLAQAVLPGPRLQPATAYETRPHASVRRHLSKALGVEPKGFSQRPASRGVEAAAPPPHPQRCARRAAQPPQHDGGPPAAEDNVEIAFRNAARMAARGAVVIAGAGSPTGGTADRDAVLVDQFTPRPPSVLKYTPPSGKAAARLHCSPNPDGRAPFLPDITGIAGGHIPVPPGSVRGASRGGRRHADGDGGDDPKATPPPVLNLRRLPVGYDPAAARAVDSPTATAELLRAPVLW